MDLSHKVHSVLKTTSEGREVLFIKCRSYYESGKDLYVVLNIKIKYIRALRKVNAVFYKIFHTSQTSSAVSTGLLETFFPSSRVWYHSFCTDMLSVDNISVQKE